MSRRMMLRQLFCSAGLIGGLLISTAALAELPSSGAAVIQKALASGQPTLIDIGARSCASCRKMAPILESLADEYQGKTSVLFVDLNEHYDAGKAMGVRMIPTQIFFNAEGKEVYRHIGFMDKPAIEQALNRMHQP